MEDISTANLYTDFAGLARLRLKVTTGEGESADPAAKAEASKEVSRQFEAIFLQNMLKTMREASQLSEETESDQTRFYMEMFDKQIAIDLASRGDGTGIGRMLEIQLGGADRVPQTSEAPLETELLMRQIRDANASGDDG